MKWHKIKAFDLSDLNPIKFINKTLDFTEGEWFEKGEKVILDTPIQDADFRKNMTTDEIDPEAVKLFNELNGQEVEIVRIDKTERGESIGLAAVAKPTYVTIRFEDGQEWKEVPTLWLEKKDGKEVKSQNKNISYEYDGYKVSLENITGKWYATAKPMDPKLGYNFLSTDGYDIQGDALRDIENQINNNFTKHYSVQDDKEIESKIVKEDGKYQAQSEKGKSFGTYDTKEEAEERLKQMEMFEHMKKSSLEENRYAVERISDLLDSGFEQEEIVDVVCNEFDCEPAEVEQFLSRVTAASNNIEAIKLAKTMRAAIKEAEEVLK